MKNQKKKPLSILRKVKFLVFDFDGVFTDNRVLVFEDGQEGVFCWRGDGLGLEALRKAGIALMAISTEKNRLVGRRCLKLNLPCIQGCGNKLKVFLKEVKRRSLDPEEVAFMGNDINDIGCLKAAGFSICVKDSHPAAMAISDYVTKTRGGYGAVREVCDIIAGANND